MDGNNTTNVENQGFKVEYGDQSNNEQANQSIESSEKHPTDQNDQFSKSEGNDKLGEDSTEDNVAEETTRINDSSKKEQFLTFHVVNSVKGGCGKSTFALLLGEYWRRNNDIVYIIDLDICGTSWELAYGNYYSAPNHSGQQGSLSTDLISDNSIYVNDIVENYHIADEKNPWRIIDTEQILYKTYSESSEEQQEDDLEFLYPNNNIHICISDPARNGELGSYEIDLFEKAIKYLIVNKILKQNRASERNIHIIFDMPPSNEKHAERVLHSILLDQFSKYAINMGPKEISKTQSYMTKLYLLSSVDFSHMESNLQYVAKLLNHHSITDIKDDMISQNKFIISVVLNDIVNSIPESSSKLVEVWKDYIDMQFSTLPNVQCKYLPQLFFPKKMQRLKAALNSTGSGIKIIPETNARAWDIIANNLDAFDTNK